MNQDSTHSIVESPIELWLTRNIFKPIVYNWIPQWVHPNYITYTNAIVCWTLLLLSIIIDSIQEPLSRHLPPISLAGNLQHEPLSMHLPPISLAGNLQHDHIHPEFLLFLRLCLPVLIFAAMTLDCLDGIHARYTDQCSRLGEVLDHASDSANTIIFACVMILFLQPNKYIIIYSLLGTTSVYNAQIILQRQIKKLIDPPVNGVEGQCVLIVSITICSIYNYYYGNINQTIFANIYIGIGCIILTKNIIFFMKQFNSESNKVFLSHNGLFLMFSFLLYDLCPLPIFFITYILLCFRINGFYVLVSVILKQDKVLSIPQEIELRKKSEAFSGYNTEYLIWFTLLFLVEYSLDFMVYLFHLGFWIRMIYLNYADLRRYRNLLIADR